MTKFVNELRAGVAAGGIARLLSGIGPQIMLEPEKGAGSGESDEGNENDGGDDAAKAAKAAADKAAADEAARIEAEKNMTDAEKEKAALVREVMEKKNKLKAEKDRADALAADLKKFEGINLDEVKTLLEERKTREQKEAEAKGDFERVKAMMVEEHKNATKALEDRIAELSGQVTAKDSTIDQLTVGQNFATSKFINDDLVLTPSKARVLYGSHFEQKDGRVVAYDKPSGAAERTMLVDATGEPMNFDAALKKIVETDPDKETLLRSKQKPGSQSSTRELPKNDNQKEQTGLYGAARITAGLEARKKTGA